MSCCNPSSFHAAARYQRVCAVESCGSGGAFHAHHVVERQRLKRLGLEEMDPRNALRLCLRCHMQHEFAGPGKVDIALSELTDENIEYAFEVLGLVAAVYLESHYTGTDRRVDNLEMSWPRLAR
jgi:hypothetical protein